MGNLIWHEYARFVAITATVYGIWAGFWGLIYRKFFWDFIGGTLRDPGGIQPSVGATPFVAVIVKIPLLQIVAMTLGFFILALEWPLPLMKKLPIYRNLVVRIVILFFQMFINILYYQGTNCALWSIIALGCYVRAVAVGEVMVDTKVNRGKVGQA